MNLIKYLQSKKILPTRETIIRNEAKRLARRITDPSYFAVKLNNREISDFTNKVSDEVLEILLERYQEYSGLASQTEQAINELKIKS